MGCISSSTTLKDNMAAKKRELPFTLPSNEYMQQPLSPSPSQPSLSRRQLLKTAALSSLSLSGCGWRLGEVRANSTVSKATDKLYVYTWTQYTDEDLLKRLLHSDGNQGHSRCVRLQRNNAGKDASRRWSGLQCHLP